MNFLCLRFSSFFNRSPFVLITPWPLWRSRAPPATGKITSFSSDLTFRIIY